MNGCTVKFTRLYGGLLFLLLLPVLSTAVADDGEVKPLSITLEGYDYAYKVMLLFARTKKCSISTCNLVGRH